VLPQRRLGTCSLGDIKPWCYERAETTWTSGVLPWTHLDEQQTRFALNPSS